MGGIGIGGRRVRSGFAGVLLLGLTGTAGAEPALWVVRDDDTTLYLFGTVHLLPADADWRSARVDAALAGSDRLWLEIDLADDRSMGFRKLMALGTSPDRTLRERLGPADHARLAAVAVGAGVDVAALETLRPWFASVNLMVKAVKAAGYHAEGPDQIFAAEASEAGKPTHGLETAAEQIAMFAGLSPEAETELLRGTIEDLEKGTAELDRMVGHWLAGDVAALSADTQDKLREAGPEVYDALLTRRNKAWAERLAAEMADPGTAFVAVGAAHLIGDHSLLRYLEEKGFVAERVE